MWGSMKYKNLLRLQKIGLNVPEFIGIQCREDNQLEKINKLSVDEVYAVRSSYNEDGGKSSSAGRYKTILGVRYSDLESAIKEVEDSYNIKNGENNATVIIQRMVESDISGVMFTCNPIGILNEMVIVVGRGLGELVVNNLTETTRYTYNRDDNKYYKIGEIDVEQRIIDDLIEGAKKIEEEFKCPMDIEFAIKDNEIYYLQARPITTLDMNKNVVILDNSNIVESYPGINLPLTQSFVRQVYHDIFSQLTKRLSNDRIAIGLDKIFWKMVECIEGRMYYRINNWYSVLKVVPFNDKIIPIWQEMLGVKNKAIAIEDVEISKFERGIVGVKFLFYLARNRRNMDKISNIYEEIIRNYTRFKEKKSKYIDDYLREYDILRNGVMRYWDLTLINDMYTFIFSYICKKLKRDIGGISGIESMKPMELLKELATKYGTTEYAGIKSKYIDKYGDRGIGELKLESLTYRTNPELLDNYIKENLDSLINWEIKRGKGKYNFIEKRAKMGIAYREESRILRGRLYGVMREIYLEIGGILEELGLLESKRDIFYLRTEEIRDYRKLGVLYKEMVESRKTEYEAYENIEGFNRREYLEDIVSEYTGISIKRGINFINGTGISKGIVAGEVLVIDSPDIMIDTTNKILVTKYTDPGWVFLIRNSLGIISECGSLLSHTAIISRELNKPAVTGIRDICKILKTGDKVRINGVTGEVEILSAREGI